MIILGRKYKFHPLEIEQIKKKYPTFTIISYTDKAPDEALETLKKKIDRQIPNLIVLNTKAHIPDKIITYLTHLQFESNIHYITIEHFLENHLYKCYIPEDQNDISFLENIKPYSPLQCFTKRVIDFTIAIPLGIVTLPIMLYSAYRIKKESPDGPIFFKQKRVGKNGVEFECVKFRSMVPDAEKGKPQFASEDDPRVFKWGATMRKTRIDELPQLINVLKGEMHMIGPRPERKYWIEQFEKEIPYYNERHLIAPGITGWAQVMYPYGANAEDAKQKLMYDLYYIKNWSLWLEIKTAFKTALVMAGKKGL